MLELNAQNFKEETKEGKVLVFFYREKGCGFCDKMKPIFEELEGDFKKAKYAVGQDVDPIAQELAPVVPAFAAYLDGKLVGLQFGSMAPEKVIKTFENGFPEKKAKGISVKEATMSQLLADEAALIDQIGPMRSHLAKVQKEIERRKKMATGKIDCCDSCADGGECSGGCH